MPWHSIALLKIDRVWIWLALTEVKVLQVKREVVGGWGVNPFKRL